MDLEGQSRLISNSAGPEWTVLHGPPGFRKAWVGGSNPFVGSVNSAKPILRIGTIDVQVPKSAVGFSETASDDVRNIC